jgi:hypothetical protein
MAVEIEVCERLMDYSWRTVADANGRAVSERHPKYHAQIKGRTGAWACGESRDEAVGNLIRTHPEEFGVSLTYLEGKLAR